MLLRGSASNHASEVARPVRSTTSAIAASGTWTSAGVASSSAIAARHARRPCRPRPAVAGPRSPRSSTAERSPLRTQCGGRSSASLSARCIGNGYVLPRRRRRSALAADAVEEAHHALPSACSRSAHNSSGSSSPTDSRSKPGGTRSPSQRERASMRDVTPPRLVAFTISVVDRLDAARGLGVCDVEREQAAEARVADGLDRAIRLELLGDRRRARRLSREPHLERLDAAKEQPRCVGARHGPVRERNSSSRAASPDRWQTTAPTSASSCPARYFVAECRAKSHPSSSGRT